MEKCNLNTYCRPIKENIKNNLNHTKSTQQLITLQDNHKKGADMETDLVINILRIESVPVLILSGDVDAYTARKLQQAIADLVANGESKIVISLAGVHYIDSSGLGTLIGGLRRIKEHNGNLAISGPNPHLRNVLNITGLGRVLPLHTDDMSAVTYLKS